MRSTASASTAPAGVVEFLGQPRTYGIQVGARW
jgi:hypothetical protein